MAVRQLVLFGDSLQAIRLFAALAGAANILLAGRIARELGGGRYAQGLTALAVLMASANLSMDHYMSMNAFEPLFWMGFAFVVIRIINTGNQKLWLWAGLIAGIGLNNKYSMAFFCLGAVVGLVLTRERRAFLQPWIWLAALLAFFLTLPNLMWNIQHHFPFLELMANIRRSGTNMAFTPLRFLVVPAGIVPDEYRFATPRTMEMDVQWGCFRDQKRNPTSVRRSTP